MNISQEM